MKRGFTLLVAVMVLLAGGVGSVGASAQATTSGAGGADVVENTVSGFDEPDTDVVAGPIPCKHMFCGP